MRIDPIEQKGTRTGLLSVATVIPGSDAWSRGGDPGDSYNSGTWPDWYRFEQEAGEAGGTVSACSLGIDVFTDPADETISPKFGPFYIYGSSRCASILARGDNEIQLMNKSAEWNLEARKNYEVEHAVWTGKDSAGADLVLSDGSTTFPDFQTAVVVGGSTARAISTVVGDLIKAARAAGLKGQITFHTPDWAFPAWADTQMLIKIGDVWYIGGEHPVVFGSGYTGTVNTLTAAATGEAPIVATGRVEYAISANVQRRIGPSTEADLPLFDARQNRTRVTVVKVATVRWNTNYVFAALALDAGN